MRQQTLKARSRRRLGHRTVVVAVTALTGVAVGAERVDAAPPTPSFGSSIDAYQDYVGQSTCDPTPKPGVVDFRDMILATYPDTHDTGISRDCDQGGQSEHKEGRAWDWGASAATQRGEINDLLNWLLATDQYGNRNAMLRRLGIMYVIFDQQIWKSYEASSGWQPYACSGVTDCHQDHVHFSFGWPGAREQTTWWTASTPPAPRHGKTTIGFYRGSDASFHLRNSNNAGDSDAAFVLGLPNMVPLAGDWNGDGKTTVGWYRPSDGSFHLRDSLSNGDSDYAFAFGPPNMIPLVGDWNGDGRDTIGFYRGSDASFHLRDSNNPGDSNYAFTYGPANMTPITGDWDNA
jgi:hypothetical protein